jgi:hypothetical protein
MYQETEGKWAYLAALVDGEGCISISRRIKEGEKLTRIHKSRANTNPYKMFSLRVAVANTNLDIMKWLIFNFGGVYYLKRKATDKHKAGYEWRPKGRKNVKTLLSNILPWVVIKPQQVRNGLEYIEMTINGERNPDKREQLYLSNKILNKKGKSVETNTLDETCPKNGLLSKIESDLVGDHEKTDQVTDLYGAKNSD